MGRPTLSGSMTILLRVVFAVMIAAGIMVAALKLLERTGDPLRQGIERAIADITQNHTYLTALPDPEFFPDIHLTMQGIVISAREDATQKIASAEEVEFSVPFLSMMTGSPVFEILNIKNIEVKPGIFFPRGLTVTHAGIEQGLPSPVFSAKGRLGDTPVWLRFDIQEKSGKTPAYTMLREAPLVFTLGPIVVKGTLSPAPDGLMLKGATMRGGKENFGPADFFVLKNQTFVSDSPISCLMLQPKDLKLTPAHPCATLFEQTVKED